MRKFFGFTLDRNGTEVQINADQILYLSAGRNGRSTTVHLTHATLEVYGDVRTIASNLNGAQGEVLR